MHLRPLELAIEEECARRRGTSDGDMGPRIERYGLRARVGIGAPGVVGGDGERLRSRVVENRESVDRAGILEEMHLPAGAIRVAHPEEAGKWGGDVGQRGIAGREEAVIDLR